MEWNLHTLRVLFELAGLTPGMSQLVTPEKEEPVATWFYVHEKT
jgi:hypothetical protein